ncbi:LLM class flavin-dependent oxidoreductase [Rhodococcus fascians]|jgi:alkanesulfonate monooxygenase SsuD/methylene tetrahydromethanopterin reductase-like flavin-dependent oxidoreductase (luciferase family)|uniref:LLM class flavin-dependent oxidoreductase n=1 Tax=Rhodococcoides fascians TaxID=1828 RepID=UPI001427BEF0|nr:LLM class flavin-dependent oxidoreductase [Rhodococcus fascians]MBY4137113.1 LLM class flavin-dependent oxidoreductase [Rhodococcus fascians]MBY4217360.1 LLM class flavin-dependent oxidoreductase [Rhodococcus fascians]MBY4221343.1 LLM class flavin-dependent oxidoreductase [Rhodococcus fascians]MBY4232656.1 LLM class flavin-dependent oxidoreductase [Rhodococcus fascians]
MTRVPLSVLDLAPISAGSSTAQALRNSLDLARQAEEWGYERYWVAEHHFVAAASSAPAVLVGLIAAATNRIRVGSAAVQLGFTTAAAVVESFGTVDALYPGRIDLGVGRSGQRRAAALTGAQQAAPEHAVSSEHGGLFPVAPAAATPRTTPLLAASLAALQQPHAEVPEFVDQLDDLVALLAGSYERDGVPLTARPGVGADVALWLFGSSAGPTAREAGARGLPFAASYHFSPGTTLEAIDEYRRAFVPSARLSSPYVAVSADVVVAETDSQARELAASFPQWVHSIRSGRGAIEYPDPKNVAPLTGEQYELVADRVDTQIVGSAATVAVKLDALQEATDADELVLTSVTYDHADRLRSYELLGREWGLPRLRI